MRSVARGARLWAEQLEPRATPAGNLTTTQVGDVLAVAGDDLANLVQIRITHDAPPSPASTVLVTGQGGTTVGGLASMSFPGVRSVRLNLGDGNDVVAADPAGDLDLAGGLTIDLGGGDNELTVVPGGRLSLGALTVRGGDGADTVTLDGGSAAGPVVVGPVTLALGDGDTSTGLTGIELRGGVRLTAGDGDDEVTLDGVVAGSAGPAGRGLVAATGSGLLDVTLAGSELGAVSLFGLGDVSLSVADTTTAAVTVTGGAFGFVDTAFDGTVGVGGGLALRGRQARLNVFTGSLTVAGGAAVRGTASAVFLNQAALAVAGSLAIRAPAGDAFVRGDGTAVTVGADLLVSGANSTDVAFDSSGASEVAGSVVVQGGPGVDTFSTAATFRTARGLRLALAAGPDAISLAGGAAVPTVGGALTVDTGSGADTVSLERVSVRGPTSILTGTGADAVAIQSESAFAGPVAINTGAGDDQLSVAALAGATGPVTFSAAVVVRLGDGNDSLSLGAAGTANAKVVFAVTGSTIDGGTGRNLLDDEAEQIEPPGPLLIGFVDPTP